VKLAFKFESAFSDSVFFFVLTISLALILIPPMVSVVMKHNETALEKEKKRRNELCVPSHIIKQDTFDGNSMAMGKDGNVYRWNAYYNCWAIL